MAITFWPEKKSKAPKAAKSTTAAKPKGGSNSIVPHLSAGLMTRAMKTFDRASAFIVLTVWGAALAFSALAYVGVEQTIKARQNLAEAEAALPVLPTIAQDPVPAPTLQQLADRLKKRLGEKVTLTPTGSQLRISATLPESYNAWLSAISYVDTISADTQWSIKQFCVGLECKDGLMNVTLDAQKVSFTAPPPLE